MPRAALFDFDGTLADSFPAITASVNHVRAARGLPALTEAEVKAHVGRGATALMASVVPGGDVEANLALYRQHHPSVLASGTRLLPGVAETLAALHAAGVGLAVCSNKPVAFTRELVRILGIDHFFAAVLGPEDVPAPKPAPDMLREALRRLGAKPAEAVYVGDMTIDIATARAAGVPVWVIATGSDSEAKLRAAVPDRVLGRFADVAGG